MKSIVRFLVSFLVLCVLGVCLVSCSSDNTETTGNNAGRSGSFACTVNKYDNLNYSLVLAETMIEDPQTGKLTPRETFARLNSKAVEQICDINGETLPADIDNIPGEHNGENHIAYTYYLVNNGERTLTYEYNLYIVNTTNNVDRGVRVRLYTDGEYVTYARTKTDGTGPEEGTVEFMGETTIVRKQVSNFRPGDYTKFTIVIWIEGNDFDTTDDIIGGQFKVDMKINIIGDEAGDPID